MPRWFFALLVFSFSVLLLECAGTSGAHNDAAGNDAASFVSMNAPPDGANAGETSFPANDGGVTLPSLALDVTATTPIYLNGGSNLSPYQTTALQQTAADLQRDLARVFQSSPPPILPGPPPADAGVVLYIATENALAEDSRFADQVPSLPGRESHQVALVASGALHVVLLEGADPRGTQYAVYTFSEQMLGIPPYWFWASWVPPTRTSLPLSGGVIASFGVPAVAWRAWFLNDQDFISAWLAQTDSGTPAPDGSTSPGLNSLDPIYETMLRLKLNAVQTGSDLSPYNYDADSGKASVNTLQSVRVPLNRGLAFVAPSLGDLSNWTGYWVSVDAAVPSLTATLVSDTLASQVPDAGNDAATYRPTALDRFWLAHVAAGTSALPGAEILWGLSFRGDGDEPYYGPPGGDADIEGEPTDPAFGQPDAALQVPRAGLYEAMYNHQAQLLKYALGTSCPLARAVYYSETQDLLDNGDLQPLSDPCIFTQYSNERREHFLTPGTTANLAGSDAAVGYYQNLNYSTSGSHYVDGEGPWKLASNYASLLAANRLQFSLLNIGNVREFGLSASANAAMLWNPAGFSPDDFVRAWTTEYFGHDAGATLAPIYAAFYSAYWQQQDPDSGARPYIFHDLRLGLAAHYLASYYGRQPPSTQTVETPFRTDNEYFDWHAIDAGPDGQVPALVSGVQTMIVNLEALQTDCASAKLSLGDASTRFFLADDLCFAIDYLLAAGHVALGTADAYQAHHLLDVAAPDASDLQAAYTTVFDVLNAHAHPPDTPGAADFRGFYKKPEKFDPHASCLEFVDASHLDLSCPLNPGN